MHDIMDEAGYQPIFDGKTLNGWKTIPRVYGSLHPDGPLLDDVLAEYGVVVPANPELHPPHWFVDDHGVLIGEQDAPGSGYGGYLISEQACGDFDLALEVRADWRAHTGVRAGSSSSRPLTLVPR